ncbi:MAG: hypothetical protein AAGA10_29960 [Bacteroidota bacterium]
MPLRISSFAFLFFLCTSIFSQVISGVYSNPEVRCKRNIEKIALEIVPVEDNYYRAYLRSESTAYNGQVQNCEIAYTGYTQEGSLYLYAQLGYKVYGESYKKGEYIPGRRVIDGRYSSSFAYPEMRIPISQGTASITPQHTDNRYICRYPALLLDTEETQRYERIRRSLNDMIEKAPTSFVEAKTDQDKIFALYKWSEKLWREYPEMTIKEISGKLGGYGEKSQKPYKLFRNEHFNPVFGTSFTLLSDKNITKILDDLDKIFYKGQYSIREYKRSKDLKNFRYLLPWQYNFLKSAFKRCGQYDRSMCRDNILKKLKEHQEQIKFYNVLLYRLENEPFSIYELERDKAKFKSNNSTLWPSEQKVVFETIERLEKTTADRDLINQVNELLRNPLSTMELQKIERLLSGTLYQKASKEKQIIAFQQLKAREEEITQKLIQDELVKLKIISRDEELQIIDQVNEWYYEFCRRFDCIERPQRTDVQLALEEFKKVKETLITLNESMIEQEITRTNDRAQLNFVKNKYFEPFQHGDPSSVALYKVLQEQEVLITQQEEIIRFKTEKIIGDFTLEKILEIEAQQTSTGEPTEDQMELAVLKKMLGVTEKFDQIAQSSYNPDNHPIAELYRGVFKLGWVKGTNIRFDIFEKVGCIKSPDRPGFTCDCNVKAHISGGGQSSVIFNDFIGPDIETYRFVKSPTSGWIYAEHLTR